MWEISNKDQAVSFFLFVALGFAFAFIYDFFKALRLSKKRGVLWVAVEDLTLFLALTLATFGVLIFRTNGQPRAFAYIAELVGFLSWRMTFSKYLVKFLKRIFTFLFKHYSKFKHVFWHQMEEIGLKTIKLLKKFKKCAKKGLKGVKRLVYNLFNKIIGK